MNEHEKWLSRRVYHETFSTSGSSFPNWSGLPNRCKCGCGGVWYDRVSPVNWWTYFDLTFPLRVQLLFPVFRAFYGVVWHLPAVIWIWFQLCRASYEEQVTIRANPGHSTSAAIVVARLFLYAVVAPLVITLYATIWILSRLGGVATMALHFTSLVLLTFTVLILFGIAVIAIFMRGLVLVIGGTASVVSSYYPAIGVALIVAGILVEYERNRRNERRHEERLGRLIMFLQEPSDKPISTDSSL